MALTSPVSRRYARAVVEAAQNQGPQAVDRAAQDLHAFVAALKSSAELDNVILNPVFTPDERKRTLEVLIEKLGISDSSKRFLHLLAERDRLGEVEAIATAVQRMADASAGRVRAEVQAAAPLSPDALGELRKALEKRTGKKVELDVKVDPSLLGGLRARIGSTVLDGTIRWQLDQLRERLMRAD